MSMVSVLIAFATHWHSAGHEESVIWYTRDYRVPLNEHLVRDGREELLLKHVITENLSCFNFV